MPHGLEAVEIDLLHFVGRRLQDHLQLVVLEQAIRVLSEPAIVRPPRRLDVGDIPRRRAEHAQQRFRMRGAGADFEVERLLDQAALRGPEVLQLENQVLERHVYERRSSFNTRTDRGSFSRCIAISFR